ncbi:hypothetical protein MNBD_CHLOROFLEXI01-1277 [hydrothermal vent metagenome]|uniref:Uncharacterized protein n=1 Tax=hydrothermal vent metagenome TaxID=652676 RepID=A0A3B0VRS7_9ZZZZ
MLSSLRETVGRASDVPAIVDDAFEGGCIYLLTEAYKRLHTNGYVRNWHENMFTAHLVVYMEQIRDDEDILLQIDPECYQYFQEILTGNQNPDHASRIDIRVKGGWVRRDVYYAMEAKILVENDWKTRRMSKLRKRYIETGVDNFVTGTYSQIVPKGCLIGYIVEGKPIHIQASINKWLLSKNRDSEILQDQHTVNDCQFCFRSSHARSSDQQSLHLYHVFLKFM